MKAISLVILLVLAAGAPDRAAERTQTTPGSPVESLQAGAGGVEAGQSLDTSPRGLKQDQNGQTSDLSTDRQGVNDQSAKLAQSREHTGAAPEILAALGELRNLVMIGIAVSLISILVNTLVFLPWLRWRGPQKSTPVGTGEVVAHAEPPVTPRPLPNQHARGPVGSVQAESPPPSPRTQQVPPLGRVEREEARQSHLAEPDEFAGLPHAAVGRTLRQFHRALPDLARKIPDPRRMERFLADFQAPLEGRIERFKEASRLGDDYLKEHWIEQDLVTTLNILAQWLSSVIEERKRGRRGNQILEEELLRWLYERLAQACRDEGWFTVEPILPFTTRFDPKIHYSVGSVALEGAANLVVTIKAVGRRDLRQNYVTQKAEVIVGR
jgi:hypothetical protein